LRQILNGLKLLHENGISNPDLSLQSIFLHNGQIKIGQVNLGQTVIAEMETDA
jgi:serine/threonine protein kinase